MGAPDKPSPRSRRHGSAGIPKVHWLHDGKHDGFARKSDAWEWADAQGLHQNGNVVVEEVIDVLGGGGARDTRSQSR